MFMLKHGGWDVHVVTCLPSFRDALQFGIALTFQHIEYSLEVLVPPTVESCWFLKNVGDCHARGFLKPVRWNNEVLRRNVLVLICNRPFPDFII